MCACFVYRAYCGSEQDAYTSADEIAEEERQYEEAYAQIGQQPRGYQPPGYHKVNRKVSKV